MSEERLTVAELLARQGKEAAPKESGRRRRRRSLEEGGISVADLTGGQPRLRESGPRRGAHSHSLGEAGEAEERQRQDAPVAEEPPKAEPEREPAPEPEREPAPIPEPEPEPVPEPRRQVTVADHAKHAGVPLAAPVSPAPVMENPDTGEMTFTFTALHDAETASQAVAQPGPMAQEARGVFSGVASVAPAPSVRKPKPESEPGPKVTPIARSQEPAPGDARTDVQEVIRDEDLGDDADVARTGVIPVVPDAAEEPPVDAYEDAAAAEELDDARAAEAEDRKRAEAVAARAEKERAKAEKKAAREEHSDIHEDNSLSIPVLIVQVFVSLMVGAGLFLAFVLLWGSTLPFVVKALIAVVVTVLMVVGANAVRRPRDTLTPWLTAIVGILLTFGPYVITLF